ncbi:MAG: sodium:proton antiporter, partial [Gammaproteobacteria bacterium]|nr:sodium:proton antiporter [Gammaproteobacteria bacterium]
MESFDFIAILLTLTAFFGYINERFFKLPVPIALMSFSLLFSLLLVLLGKAGLPFDETARVVLQHFDFSTFLLHGILSFLLFAGAIRADINDLLTQKRVVILLATLGLVLSTAIVGFLSQWLLQALGLDIPLIYCLLFGALISPTDPIAVMSLLKSMNLPKSVHTKIMGESLFNDGVAVVLFLTLLGIAIGDATPTTMTLSTLLFREIVGGAILGLLCGGLAYYLLKGVKSSQVAIFITLALVSGSYALADSWHLSGPIAVVAAGLLIGSLLKLSYRVRIRLDEFWELFDELLNALLFILIGLEVLIMPFEWHYLSAGLLLVPVVLTARYFSVGVPILLLKPFRRFTPNIMMLLTWGGLRGGISIAMALSLPSSSERELIVAMTYVVVIVSVLFQGLVLTKCT